MPGAPESISHPCLFCIDRSDLAPLAFHHASPRNACRRFTTPNSHSTRNSTVGCFVITSKLNPALPLPMLHQPPRFQMPPRSVLTHPFVFISLQTPFSATPLFSHPSKSPRSVPSRRSYIPTFQTLRAAVKPFAAYHIPATPAVSCNYTLFRATAGPYPACSQQLPHSFYRHGGGTPLP